MKFEKKIFLDIVYVILGAVLLGCGIAEIVDSFWSGMGGALIGIGAIRIFQFVKFRKNPEYREKIETEANDERNKFISERAWAWAGYAFVILSALGTIGFKIAGNEVLSQVCAYAVCLIMVFYWIAYLILRRKY